MDTHKIHHQINNLKELNAHQVFCIACSLIGVSKKEVTKQSLAKFCSITTQKIDKMCEEHCMLGIILSDNSALEVLLVSQAFSQVFPRDYLSIDEKSVVKKEGDKEFSATDTKYSLSEASCAIPILIQLLSKVSQSFVSDIGLSGAFTPNLKLPTNLSRNDLLSIINALQKGYNNE